jgi:hypothetical protein
LLVAVVGLALVVASIAALEIAAPAGERALGADRSALLRVDQLGYLPGDTKIAYLMAPEPVSGETYAVLDRAGRTIASGPVSAVSRGAWNRSYPAVYPIDFSSARQPGSYRVLVSGPLAARSDWFRIESAAALYRQLVLDGVNFFANQRDGTALAGGTLHLRPSHLHDARAYVFATPRFAPGGSDVIRGQLRRIGGPTNVEGGWFDAGDDLKFTFTASYADDLLFAAARALGNRAPRALSAEARHGIEWLQRMWNPASGLLYLQVGIGSGNETSFFGDHDLWRLPQQDDSDRRRAYRLATAQRPVFEAAPPGALLAPDLAGRVAAAFAFAAQADAAVRRARATAELALARSVYGMADTHPTGTLQTTLPSSYYPESIWHDAMELGATEIVLAEQDLGVARGVSRPYLVQASRWARDYIAGDSGRDTLNLYDVGALAHADLVTAIARAGAPSGLSVTRAGLVADLRAQLAAPARRAASDIFHEGGDYTSFDVDSHTFGFISTEALYRRLTGERTYSAFAGEQRDWLFGSNAWGESFMVGVGTTFPHCMQSQVANLAGSLDGSAPIDLGAVVNGPNGAAIFTGGLGGLQSGMRRCENDGGLAFTGHDSTFVDDVRAWQTDEPALDMTGSAILAAALQQ